MLTVQRRPREAAVAKTAAAAIDAARGGAHGQRLRRDGWQQWNGSGGTKEGVDRKHGRLKQSGFGYLIQRLGCFA